MQTTLAPIKNRILYYDYGQASGKLWRGITLYKAVQRLSLDAAVTIAHVHSPYADVVNAHLPYNNIVVPSLDPAIKHAIEPATFLQETLNSGSYDTLVVSGSFIEAQAVEQSNLKRWLVVHDFFEVAAWLNTNGFDADKWAGIGLIEPTSHITGLYTTLTNKYPNLRVECLDAPVLATWSDEIPDPDTARRELWHITGTWPVAFHFPLVLVMQNGLGNREMQDVVRAARDTFGDMRGYTIRFASQHPESQGSHYPLPMSKYFGGIDYLVSAGGQTTFWDWIMYSNYDDWHTRAVWVPQQRQLDGQQLRLDTLLKQPQHLDYLNHIRASKTNGADQLIRILAGTIDG